jgi:hypothetical protein
MICKPLPVYYESRSGGGGAKQFVNEIARATRVPWRNGSVARGTKAAIVTILWLAPLLIFLLAFHLGWRSTWAALGVPGDALPFADLRGITGALVTLQKHGDPLLANPADPWKRPMNYPRAWAYLFSILGISNNNVSAVGIAFSALYVLCVSELILRCKRGWDAFILLVAGLSLAPLYAMELGNTDLFIFALVFLGCRAAAEALQSSAFAVASVLKIYPVAAAAMHSIRQPVRQTKQKTALLFLTAIVLGSFAWQWRDLQAIRRSTPVSSRMAYGTLSTKAQLEEEWGFLGGHAAVAGWAVVVACWLAGGAAIAIARKSRWQLDEGMRNSADAKLFSIFGAIYVLSFAVGSNWDYRLIFLLPTLPLALELAHNPTHPLNPKYQRWAIAYIVAVLLAENPLDLRSIYGTSVSHIITLFLFLAVSAVLTLQCKPLSAERPMASK